MPFRKFSLITIVSIASLFCHASFSKEIKKDEKYFNHIYCKNASGEEEFKLANSTRVDCLTDEFAIEMDWAKKWYEGITQALYYGMETNKKPKLVLIIKSDRDYEYYQRAAKTIKHYALPVKLVTIKNL